MGEDIGFMLCNIHCGSKRTVQANMSSQRSPRVVPLAGIKCLETVAPFGMKFHGTAENAVLCLGTVSVSNSEMMTPAKLMQGNE